MYAGVPNPFEGNGIWGIVFSVGSLVLIGLFIAAAKYKAFGWETAVRGDRIFRERKGKAVKYFEKEGLLFWIAKWHWFTKANINPQTLMFNVPINSGGIGSAIGSFDCQIRDSRAMVHRAIYNRSDPNRGDKQNDERILFVQEVVESAVNRIVTRAIKKGRSPASKLTLERIILLCNEPLLERCGTEIIGFRIKSIAPSAEQVEAEAKREAARTLAVAIEKSNAWQVVAADDLINSPTQADASR